MTVRVGVRSRVAGVFTDSIFAPGQKKLNPLEQTPATSSRTASLSPQIPDKHATSFLLQGNPRNHTKKLFLFPDGGGSASSYTNIPNLSPDIAVYGLNSPFMTTPEEYTCGVSGIARYFLQEIKRRQDQGPYNIGVSIYPCFYMIGHTRP